MNRTKDYNAVLNKALTHSISYINNTEDAVCAVQSLNQLREALRKPLSENGMQAEDVIDQLVEDVQGGLLSSTGGRFFAWVIGGAVPAGLAADWLTSTWDQNAGMYACSPAASVIEEVAGEWLKMLFRLPMSSSFAFTTGCQMAHATALAAARNEVLRRQQWDVEVQGLSSAPKIHIVTNRQRHLSFDRAVRLLGMGTESIIPIEVNALGCIEEETLREVLNPMKGQPIILQLCAGEINTGAFDNFQSLIPLAHEYGAWVHVDGAFGLWANASETYRHLLAGVELADSWATDGHKWLNVPYDSGYAFVRHTDAHKASMSMKASYLSHASEARDALDWNPEMSRRARGIPTYAAIRQLGTKGIADMIDSSCDHARELVTSIGKMKGAEMIWQPTINQGLIRFVIPESDTGDLQNDAFTDRIIHSLNETGKIFVGGTNWKGMRCMRISVCGWQTDANDITISLQTVESVLHEALNSFNI